MEKKKILTQGFKICLITESNLNMFNNHNYAMLLIL